MKYKDITFFTLWRSYGYWRVLLAGESFIAAGIVTLLWLTGIFPFSNESMFNIYPIMISATVSLFALTIAGFAVVLATLDKKFAADLFKKGVLAGLLFPFWWVAVMWVITSILFIIGYLVAIDDQHITTQNTMMFVSMFFWWYTLLATSRLIGTVIRFALVRSYFSSRKESQE